MGESFSTFQVAEILGIKYGRLREWIDKGYIEPSISKADGQGTKTLFSEMDLYGMGLFVYLIERKLFVREEAKSRVKAVLWHLNMWKVKASDMLQRCPYVAFYYQSENVFEIETSKPFVRTFSQKDIDTKPLNALLWKDWKWKEEKFQEFDDVTLVNFGKIISEIRAKLTD